MCFCLTETGVLKMGVAFVVLSTLIAYASVEVGMFTLGYKHMTGNWWWHREKKDWAFSLTSDSWGFSGKGQNPIDTLKKMVDDITGRNRTFKDIIHDEIHAELQKRTRNAIKGAMSSKSIRAKASKMIADAIEEELKSAK